MARYLYEYVFYLRYIAQLLTKNLWYTVDTVSTARFAEL